MGVNATEGFLRLDMVSILFKTSLPHDAGDSSHANPSNPQQRRLDKSLMFTT
ncbi:hypothetical protein SAMN05216534_0141 [Candidatus Aquiluna sp. UB-MaderosW2red]|nr:hypothetical protein SAMN05216534_0141 [Candidatus Aquiluna sp. UB-MaderosW2red]